MSTISENAKAIFLEAVEKHSPEDWPEFLDQACGDDRELRGAVEGLLQAHAEKDSLFDRVEATRDYQPLVQTGQMIGPYKIREQIGDGGMGVVYVAEQEKPLRRKVALKVIKPGMDSKAVLARFDAERNALALMNHPNIAKVLDAGTTEQGRPYFVMELIQGKPITEYCDQKKSDDQRATGSVHADLQRRSARAPERRHPPRHQALQHPGHRNRRQTSSQSHRLWRRQSTERQVSPTARSTPSFQSLVGTPLYMSPEQTSSAGSTSIPAATSIRWASCSTNC